jgi:hypothetical protein
MLGRVALVRTGVSEDRLLHQGDNNRWTKKTLATTSNRVRRLLVAASVFLFTDSCHPDEGGARFLRNVGSYKSHMV